MLETDKGSSLEIKVDMLAASFFVNLKSYWGVFCYLNQRYTYRVFQTIQIELILLCVWVEPAALGSAKTALRFKYEI